MDQEARSPAGDIPVRVPAFMKEIVAALTAELRRSPHVNHRSGDQRPLLDRQRRDARSRRGPARGAGG